ncbi:hypothetical protein M501DRAFT_1005844 [Patellaria atrata CBS 101060]|uniref:GST N-terminal domain-containing protein n=1 Tax=Patellaria atrata CBS 101060 TaxID=1346257 RepID=A0A9P4SJY7_9PEZI|nr:hypothetical protein M501DRAFT_1005844 [Patellaria atrata CBS 101060]
MTEKPIHEAGTADGWHGEIKQGGQFPPERERYHLYIGLFCPFAHRVNLVRHLANLTSIIDISIVKPFPKGDDKGWPGWRFPKTDDEYTGATVDKLFGSEYLHEVYFRADKEYKGRYSVPVLWDKKAETIICNESAEMLRWLPTSFASLGTDASPTSIDLYPEHLRSRIDDMSGWIQEDINTGVYKAGFASEQATYDEQVLDVFYALNRLEREIHQNKGPYVLGAEMTELDLRCYATIIRFDAIYVQHFKCNMGTIRHDYPVIRQWLSDLYFNDGLVAFKKTTNFKHIKENYTKSHAGINPKAITPLGPYPHVEQSITPWKDLKAGGLYLREFWRLG